MTRRVKIAVESAAITAALLAASIFFITRTTASSDGPLNLPRIAWAGGPAYWNQFPAAKAAGWTNPNFFPIVMWFDSVSSSAEVQADKSYGVNTYIGEPQSVSYDLIAENKMFVLNSLAGAPTHATAQPGLFLTDEPDGYGSSSAAALKRIDSIVKASPKDGGFDYINFSDTVLSNSDSAVNLANFEAMLNSYSGPVSVDKYYYTQPSCFDIRYLSVSIDPAHCRTASSYGATVRALRNRLAATGHLKPLWNFVEDLSGAPDANHFYSYIQPGQLEGAVMDSIINEAGGIIYFNQSFAGTCTGGNIIRQAQEGSLSCAQSQMNAVKQVDQRIQMLAPVINTQSFKYSFGLNLDTMLKTYQGSAYIFSMISGAASSEPGRRTFTLPPALAGATSVKVLFENRTIPVVDGKFTDNFAAEYSYHIYKVAM